MTALRADARSVSGIGVFLVNHTSLCFGAIIIKGQGTTVNHAFLIVFVSVCSPVCEAMHMSRNRHFIITANITGTI